MKRAPSFKRSVMPRRENSKRWSLALEDERNQQKLRSEGLELVAMLRRAGVEPVGFRSRGGRVEGWVLVASRQDSVSPDHSRWTIGTVLGSDGILYEYQGPSSFKRSESDYGMQLKTDDAHAILVAAASQVLDGTFVHADAKEFRTGWITCLVGVGFLLLATAGVIVGIVAVVRWLW